MIVVALCLVPTPNTIRTKVMATAPMQTKKAATRFIEGMRVSHAKFGVGIVKEKIGQQLFRVTFEDQSTKTIRHDFLSLI